MTGICNLPIASSKSASAESASAQPCPCVSGRAYAECCEPVVTGVVQAATAEALMRSRYSAFVKLHREHLQRSWWPASCPERIHLNPDQRWLGLEIRQTDAGGSEDEQGSVEFIARFKVGGGKAERLHERSRFRRYGGQWYYVDGERMENNRAKA